MNMTTINSTNWHVHVSNEQFEGHSHRKVKVNIYISHKTFPKFAHLALIVHASFGVWLTHLHMEIPVCNNVEAHKGMVLYKYWL